MRIVVFIGLFALGIASTAQSIGTINTYQYDLKLINPAFTGISDTSSFNFIYQDFWTNVSGSPQSVLVSYEHDLNTLKGDLGFMFVSLNQGLRTRNRTNLFLAKEIVLKTDQSLHLGANLIYESTTFDFSQLNNNNPGDPAIPTDNSGSNEVFYLDFGVAFERKNLLVGGAVQNLEVIENNSLSISTTRSKFYNLFGQYELHQIFNDVMFKPYVLYQTTSEVWRLDTGLDVEFFEMITVGGRVRFFEDESAYLLTSSVELKDWVRVYMVLADQFVQQRNSSESGLGNNFEMGLRVFMPD